jgi:hypothetical protein
VTPINRLEFGAVLLSLVIATACSNGPNNPIGPVVDPLPPPGTPRATQDVGNFITGVSSSDGASGAKRTGAPPSASGGPAAQVNGNGNVVNGGSTQTTIRGGSTFQRIFVFVSGAGGGVDGFWEVTLSRPATDATLFVTLARTLPMTSFNMTYAVATSSGAVGASAVVPARVLAASSGEVQVSVSWDAGSDVDLHVVDPRGEEIYYGNTQSTSGGELDLDSNAGCSIDNKNNENIRWPSGRAPSGSYTVKVDYWDSCGVPSTNFIVTVNNGGSTQTYRGSFTGGGDSGDAGSGRTIATFTHSGGSMTTGVAEPLLRLLAPSAAARAKLQRAAGLQR